MDWNIPNQKDNDYKDAHALKHITNIIIWQKCECGVKGIFLGEPKIVREKVMYPSDFN